MTPRSPKYCPHCNRQGLCIDSRQATTGIYRRYKCPCGRRWTTREMSIDQIDDALAQRPLFVQLRRELNAAIDHFFASHTRGQ